MFRTDLSMNPTALVGWALSGMVRGSAASACNSESGVAEPWQRPLNP